LAFAQTPELLRVKYGYLPDASIIESNDSVQVGFSELEASILAPIKLSDKLMLLAGGTYVMVFPQSTINELETKLYFIALRLTTIYNFDNKNRLVGTVTPAISSTLQDEITSDDFLTQASLAYFREVSEQLNYGIGLIYTSRFGYPRVLPLLALNYKREEVKYEITLPVLLQATWAYNKGLSYSLKLSVGGSQYNAAQGAQFNGIPVDAVNFSRILIGPEIGIRLKRQLYLTVFGGISVRRLFELNSDSGPTQDLGVNNGAFISTKISIIPNRNQQSYIK
jgi:hypothetical protein